MRIDQRANGAVIAARSSFARVRTPLQSLALSRIELVVYLTLMLLLFASAFIYVPFETWFNQSNIRCDRSPGAFGSQDKSAPSEATNLIRVFGHLRAS